MTDDPRFGDRPYRKRYLVTVIADRATDEGDDWASCIGDGLASEHCLWNVEEVESADLSAMAGELTESGGSE